MRKIKPQHVSWRDFVATDPDLSFGAKAIGLYLNIYMNTNQSLAYPSLNTISREMSVTKKTAIKYIAELEQYGFLVKTKRFNNSNIYQGVIPKEWLEAAGMDLDEYREWVVEEIHHPSLKLVEEVHRGGVNITPRVVEEVQPNNPVNNPKNNPIKSRTKRPALDEVKKIVTQKGYHFDPEDFYNHYEAIGWVYGKNKIPIKKWQSCCLQWEKRHKDKNPDRSVKLYDATGKEISAAQSSLI